MNTESLTLSGRIAVLARIAHGPVRLANRESPRATKFFDRGKEEISLDEVEGNAIHSAEFADLSSAMNKVRNLNWNVHGQY
jgi:hypothetical protein